MKFPGAGSDGHKGGQSAQYHLHSGEFIETFDELHPNDVPTLSPLVRQAAEADHLAKNYVCENARARLHISQSIQLSKIDDNRRSSMGRKRAGIGPSAAAQSVVVRQSINAV
jgi:hypothetical protein